MNRAGLSLSVFAFMYPILVGVAVASESARFSWPIPGGKIGMAGKNLQVLPYDDVSELVSYMQEIQGALGVTCVYCHNLDDFALDDPKVERSLHKNAARSMTRMVLNINDYMKKDRFLNALAGPSLFRPGDLKEPGALAVKLWKAEDALSEYLLEQFSDDTGGLLNDYDGSGDPSELLQKALIDELNRLLEDSRLYDRQRFAHVELTGETRGLIAQDPHDEDLIRLNRLLLEEAYPYEIARARSVSCFMCHQGKLRPSQEVPSAGVSKP